MALTRITKGVIKPNENYDTHNIVSTGIVTSVGLDVNGNADVSGSLSVGGVLTYEDVTSIDSVGIITARSGLVSPYADIDDFVSVGSNIHLGNAGVVTATSFVGDGSGLIGVASTDNIVTGTAATFNTYPVDINAGMTVAGVTTFTGAITANGAIDLNADLDVDGHTNLDNVSIAGVTTFADDVKAVFGNGGDLEIYHESSSHKSILKESGASGFHFQGSNIVFDNTAGNKRYLNMVDGGAVSLYFNSAPGGASKLETTSAGVLINGAAWLQNNGTNITANGLGVDASIFHNGDENTGIDFASSNDQINFRTSGTVRATVQNNGLSVVGVMSALNATISGDLDVDGHTNLDNVSIAGLTTASQGLRVPNGSATTNYISVGDSNVLRFWGTTHSFADIRNGNLHFRNNSLQNILELQQDKDIFLYGPSYFSDTARFDSTVTIADTITHHGDTNTKIRFPSNDNISFEVGGVERLRIDNVTGNQVIARDATASIMRVENSTAATGQVAMLDLAPAGSLSGVQLKATSEEDYSTGANRTAFFTVDVRKDGTFYERLRIDSTGNLSLGKGSASSTSYGRNLQIHHDGTSGAAIHLTDNNTGSGNGDGFHIISTSSIAYLWQRENANMVFGTNGSARWNIYGSNGHLAPNADSTFDIGTSSVRVRNGYFDTLYGDGSNLTGLSGVSVANQADNRLITATGTTDALNGESTLTYNGNRLFAPSISATDNGAGSPLLSLRQDDQNPWAFEIGNDTYGTGTNGLMGYVENGGDMLIRYRGISAYKSLTIEQHDGSSNRAWMSLGNGGNVVLNYQGNTKLTTVSGGVNVTGDLTATGFIDSSSDIKLKTNIKTIDNALDKVLQLRGAEYDRIDRDNQHEIGVIAQEVEKIIPEVVHGDETKTVSYGNMVAVLIEAIKEQNEVINEMKKEIDELKSS